ncbi:MAG TPA: hypothetical protein DD412_00860, partial [Holosporales bacterium]|nr:hypothetical protein [Holosporales bacterium]
KANFHFDVDKEGNRKPHCHAVMLTRRLEENGLSPMKERSWNHKDLATEWRKGFCSYSNAAFKKLGLDIVLDPRTYAEQGINIEPQTKLSRNTLEIEQRHGVNPKDILSTPVTTRGQDFQEISLRNLYKIIDNPKIVLEDISKQQMTFMWGDVVKFLARHIDDQALFERVCLKLQASDELVCIKEGGSLSQRVFTTKTRLEEETRFVEGVRSLKDSHTHTVDPEVVQSVIDSTNKGFQERSEDPEASLSNDQVRAIHHMASSDQLSFIEGYAGAGKTTVMRGMKEIWEASGLKVYGLAPTGRASDNLADCGISSQTVDRFLKSYENGHNQLNSKSIIVLDEAGMVSSKNFTALIDVTKQLGIKLVACGDRGQLSPVEAGAPFRLAINEIGKADLTTVLRQKVPWQSQATSLFGEGKTEDALRLYGEHGRIKIVEESLPRDVVEQYNLSRRITGNIAHEMNQDIERAKEHGEELTFKKHQDYPLLIDWKNTRDACTKEIFENIKTYKDVMKEMGVDGVDFCNKVINHPQNLTQAYDKCRLAKTLGIDWRINVTHTCDPRLETKKELLSDWFKSTQGHPDAKQAMMAYSNKDVLHLNMMARQLKKESGEIGKEEFTYIIERNDGEELGKRRTLLEERTFSKGDQIVFTENNTGLGVRNGTLGQITSLDKSKITATFKEEGVEKEVSFAPNLYKRFDNGWALTIHKNQGATVDLAFKLASFEEYKNLSYVGMTRHEKDAKLYGSDFDFYRDEKIYDRLGRHQDKLSSLDYLSPEESEKLLRSERQQLNKAFDAFGRKLDAVGYVGGRAWSNVCNKFLGRTPESNLIRLDYEALHYHQTEVTRADEVLRGVKYDDSILPRDVIPKTDVEIEDKKATVSEAKEKQKSPEKQIEPVTPISPSDSEPKKAILPKEELATTTPPVEPVVDTVASEPDKKTVPEIKENRKAAIAKVEQAVEIEPPQKQQRPRKQKLPTQDFQKFVRDVESSIRIEDLAKDVLGAQNLNTSLSNSSQLRFGCKGSLSVELKGQHAGFWKNWESNEKGGPLKLIQNEKGLDFNGALAFASSYCRGNISNDIDDFLKGKKLREVSPAERQEQEAEYKAERLKQAAETHRLNTAKVQDVQALIEKAQTITGTPAEIYLRKERGIQGELPDSLRYIPPQTSFSYKGKRIPIKSGALLSIAKDRDGEVKAIQITQLTGDGKKVVGDDGIKLPKKTYGVQKGSFVELQKGNDKDPIILAEGIETALSVKEIGLKGTVLCSLGTANIGNLKMKDREIIIATDWDGSIEVQSWKATEKAKANLEAKGNSVSIILPVKDSWKNPKLTNVKLDFNDLLKQEGLGSVIDRLIDQVPGLVEQKSTLRENQVENTDDRQKNHSLSQNQSADVGINPSTNTPQDQEKLVASMDKKGDEKTSQEATLKNNILAYFEQELSKPENRNWNKGHLLEDVQKDPFDTLNWWKKECGGGDFDPSKPLSEQPSSLQVDITFDDKSKTPGDDFVKDFIKELKNLDDSIERVSNKQEYQGALANYTQQREDLLKGLDDSKIADLKSHESELAHRVEETQKQQPHNRGAGLGI